MQGEVPRRVFGARKVWDGDKLDHAIRGTENNPARRSQFLLTLRDTFARLIFGAIVTKERSIERNAPDAVPLCEQKGRRFGRHRQFATDGATGSFCSNRTSR